MPGPSHQDHGPPHRDQGPLQSLLVYGPIRIFEPNGPPACSTWAPNIASVHYQLSQISTLWFVIDVDVSALIWEKGIFRSADNKNDAFCSYFRLISGIYERPSEARNSLQ